MFPDFYLNEAQHVLGFWKLCDRSVRPDQFEPQESIKSNLVESMAGLVSSTGRTCVVLLLFVLSLSSANKTGRNLRFFGDVHDCELSNPCMNGATWINNGINNNGKKKIRCECSPGYSGHTCAIDINECTDFLVDACCDQDCFNNDGGYTCGCSVPGYKLAVDGCSCVDVDECSDGTHSCDEDCFNELPRAGAFRRGYNCGCSTNGYELGADGLICTDIDECADETDQCEEDCTNTDGDYTCSCSTPGYELDGDYECVDIDECADETDQCEEDCTNTDGGYTCSCSTPGYELDGDYECVDIDECADEMDQCEEDCTNTDGGYTCSCSTPGYELDGDYECVVNRYSMCLSAGALWSEQRMEALDSNGVTFGWSVALLGDVDGDGVPDLAVTDLGQDGVRGAVYVVFLNADRSVKGHQKINSAQGGMKDPLDAHDHFGRSVTALGDLDGDRVPDMSVGAAFDDDGGVDRGALYIFFLNADGTVKREQKISSTQGGLAGPLGNSHHFGNSAAVLGDLDGDGVVDLAVGGYGHEGYKGTVHILFLNADGSVKRDQEISSSHGGLTGPLEPHDYFGSSVAGVGDLNGDGVVDLVAGAQGDDDGGADRGALYILLLNSDGTVNGETKISSTQGQLVGPLRSGDWFGNWVAALGDLDGDRVVDLAVGAFGDDDGGSNAGALYIILLNVDGTVKGEQKISSSQGGMTGPRVGKESFGTSVALLGDLDGDGFVEIAVGAIDLDLMNPASGGSVYMIEVTPGFVPVCGDSETCLDTAEGTYECTADPPVV